VLLHRHGQPRRCDPLPLNPVNQLDEIGPPEALADDVRLLTPLGAVVRCAALVAISVGSLFASFTGDFVTAPSRVFAFLCPFSLGLLPVVGLAAFVRRRSLERRRPLFLAALALYVVAIGYRSLHVASFLGISGPPPAPTGSVTPAVPIPTP
jgi:ABC-type uncharacterized transport system permease subunit